MAAAEPGRLQRSAALWLKARPCSKVGLPTECDENTAVASDCGTEVTEKDARSRRVAGRGWVPLLQGVQWVGVEHFAYGTVLVTRI